MSAQVIGYLGENGVRDVRIPIGHLLDKWQGLRPLLVMVPVGGSDDEAYPVQYTLDGTDLVWHISDADTAVAGTTKAAVRMVDDGGRVGMDEPFQVIISPNLSASGEPPLVIKPWVDKLATLVPRAESAAERAENATERAENAAERAENAAERVETGTAPNALALGGQLPSYYATAESVSNIFYNNASAHNSIYRGKNLGSAVTAEQYAAIQAGTFDDMYIGDYWVINGVDWRIAAFDYYYRTGDTNCTTHHVVIVPDTALYTAQMNTSNVTTGAYVGSAMYTSNLANAKTAINNAFGSGHILSHRQYLQNATTNGYASAGGWYDSTVELMTEQNVYGCMVFGNCINGTNVPKSYTVDKSQFPLFALDHTKVNIRSTYWLRDVDSAYSFCIVGYGGGADYSLASDHFGVRPAFSIKS